MKNCKKRKRYLHPSSLEAAVYWRVVVLGFSQRVVADEFETSQASICRMCRRVRAWLFGCEESLLARQEYGHTQSRIPEAYSRTEYTEQRGVYRGGESENLENEVRRIFDAALSRVPSMPCEADSPGLGAKPIAPNQ
jgi:hypothetical protein